MKTINTKATDTFREKGSKFTGYLFPIEGKAYFEQRLDEIKAKYPDATHHCYAWRYDPTDIKEFAQDDGEPGGTAGLPILNQLKSFETINTGLVVVRYYGGTKLGKSGLIEAYGHTAALCLNKAKLQPIKLVHKLRLQYPYSEQSTVDRLMHQYDLIETDAQYLEKVTLTLACPVDKAESLKINLKHLSHRGFKAELLKKDFI